MATTTKNEPFAGIKNAGDATVEQSPHSIGKCVVNNAWYFALPSYRVARGKTVAKKMLGQPVIIGRDNDGKVFALTNICPHQGVPLSCGDFDGRELECPFHGWKFDTKGVCTLIPALMPDQEMNLNGIKTGNYPCREVHGIIWVYFGKVTDNLPEVPAATALDEYVYGTTTSTVLIPTHFDYAMLALIDPAHVPYVHTSWYWRSKKGLKDKTKKYVPSGTGWTMVKHAPSRHSPVFKLLGQYLETEISFKLPASRFEYIYFRNRIIVASTTTVTPIDDTTCELNHTSYWTIPFISWFMRPFVNFMASDFVGQDQAIATAQAEGLKYNPKLIVTIRDSGTPGAWYLQGKREWNDATEENRPFVNPVKETTLRWRT